MKLTYNHPGGPAGSLRDFLRQAEQAHEQIATALAVELDAQLAETMRRAGVTAADMKGRAVRHYDPVTMTTRFRIDGRLALTFQLVGDEAVFTHHLPEPGR